MKKETGLRWLAFGALALVILFIAAKPGTVYAASGSDYYIQVNRKQNCVTIYEKDAAGNYTVPVKAMVCSVGEGDSTPAGSFQIGQKYRWHELYGSVYGQYCSRFTGHILFHSVGYEKEDPGTLEYEEYNRLGEAASLGCVRLSVADAKWIYDNCGEGTTVKVYDGASAGPLGKPSPIRIDTSVEECRGWDPTDPSGENPWKTLMPKLTGAENQTVECGAEEAVLTEGVKAWDYRGRELTVTISGMYNLGKSGAYQVKYTAADCLGNCVQETVTINVTDTPPPEQETVLTENDICFADQAGLENYLKQYACAADRGRAQEDRYAWIGAEELWDAIQKKRYGIYAVSASVSGRLGTESEEKLLLVQYSP